jgi:hypothetical protein
MKFLVPNYSCLQNPWLGGHCPQIPVLSVLCPQPNLLNSPLHRTKFLGMPLVPVQFCQPQIPHGLVWDQMRTFMVRGQCLTTWAMTQTCSNSQMRIINICIRVLNRCEEGHTSVKIKLTVRPQTHICIQASFRSMCPSSGRSSSHCPPCTVLAYMNTGQFLQCCGSAPAQTCRLLCLDVHTVTLKHKLLYAWTTKLS